MMRLKKEVKRIFVESMAAVFEILCMSVMD